MKRVILLSVVILLISLGYSFADVPCMINYQGRLIEDNVPVDGTKTMRFSIYDSLEDGDELWTSGDVNVEVHNGLFRYVIGSDGGDLSSIPWTAGETLYLEVKVGTEVLTPREPIYAYPYAINTHLLEGCTIGHFLDISGSTQTKKGGLNIEGKVGIGTTEPAEKLDVVGNIAVSGNVDGRDVSALSQFFWKSSPSILILTADDEYHDLDVTPYTSSNATYVIANVYFGSGQATTAQWFYTRQNGSSETRETLIGGRLVTHSAGFFIQKVDADQIFEYKIYPSHTNTRTISILGWLE